MIVGRMARRIGSQRDLCIRKDEAGGGEPGGDEVERDLRNGSWDQRNRHLRELAEFDVGMRLVVARP